MKNLKINLHSTQKMTRNGGTFDSYFAVYQISKDTSKTVAVSFSKEASAQLKEMTLPIGVVLQLSENKDEKGTAFMTWQSRKGDDGKYHFIKGKNGELFPQLVITDLSRHGDVFDFPTSEGFRYQHASIDFMESDDDLPF